jgi:membrane complex biogenesis BtpA family protein
VSAPSLPWLAADRALVGVVHLAPLPGAPRDEGSVAAVIDAALRDATAWAEGGADAVLVENFGDAPFYPGAVPAETVAALTAAAREVRRAVNLPLGVNVLRNDAEAALAVAVAAEARFIRVNVLTHAYVTDQGLIEGRAHHLLRLRRRLGADTAIFADVLVKHAVPAAPLLRADAVRDLASRGGADAVLVTGRATGGAPSPEETAETVAAAGETPVFVASGVTPENAGALLAGTRGAVVGTWCEREGSVDAERVRRAARAVHGA